MHNRQLATNFTEYSKQIFIKGCFYYVKSGIILMTYHPSSNKNFKYSEGTLPKESRNDFF